MLGGGGRAHWCGVLMVEHFRQHGHGPDRIKEQNVLFSKRLTKIKKVSCFSLRNLDAKDVRKGRGKVALRRGGLFGLLPFLM